MRGGDHFPQPDSWAHLGFAMSGASHSPSISVSQSVGCLASESATISGSSSAQSSGLVAFGSGIFRGSFSSQSSGLTEKQIEKCLNQLNPWERHLFYWTDCWQYLRPGPGSSPSRPSLPVWCRSGRLSLWGDSQVGRSRGVVNPFLQNSCLKSLRMCCRY